MAEPALVEETKVGPNSWLNESKFIKVFMMSSVGQRVPAIAKNDAQDAFRVVTEKNLSDADKKWLLECIAMNAGKSMGVPGLVQQAQLMLKAI